MTPDQREEMRIIFRRVAAEHGLDEADLYVRDRSTAFVKARSAAWGRCYRAGYSFPVIAALAGWDHTSVMHGVDNYQRKSDPIMFRSRRSAQ